MPPRREPIPLVSPTLEELDVERLRRRLAEGLLGDDAEVGRYEALVARATGTRGALATPSGTAALHLALAALGVGPGDEVILPTYTCVAVLNAVHLVGATPRLVDIVADAARADFHPTAAQIRGAMTSATKAIVLVHMFGALAPETDAICALGVPVVEDFTLSLGARRQDGRHAGALGRVGVASTHASKMVSTGQGGVLVTDDDALLDRARALANYGAKVPEWRVQDGKNFHDRYQRAFAYGFTPMQAALGIAQWERLDAFVARRQALARRYDAALQGLPLVRATPPRDRENVYYRYMVELQAGADPPQLIQRIRKRGAEFGRGLFPPLHLLTGESAAAFPGTTRAISRMLSVPLHPSLTDEEAAWVLDALRAEIGSASR